MAKMLFNIKTKSFSLLLLMVFTSALFAGSIKDKLDELVTRYNEYGYFNGAVLVADSTGVLLQKGYGFADFENNIKNSVDTKFRIGSVSKQFTAMLIMQLVNEGKLKVTDKLSYHLPYYRKDTGAKVSVKNLLQQTSGIPNSTARADIFEICKLEYQPEELIKLYCSDDLNFEPGKQFEYSNSNYMILGAIVENVTGMTLAEAYKQYIFAPLEMDNSTYVFVDDNLENKAIGYSQGYAEHKVAPEINLSFAAGAGGINSTVGDLYKWNNSFHENSLIPGDLKEEMFTPNLGFYGYGFFINDSELKPGERYRVISHTGGINGFSSYIVRVPELKQVVILLANVETEHLTGISQNIYRLMNNLEYAAPKMPVAKFLWSKIKTDVENPSTDIVNLYEMLKQEEGESFLFDEIQLVNLASVLQEKNPDLAIKLLKKNTEDYIKSENSYGMLAGLQLQKGFKEEAITNYKKVLEINPGNEKALEKLDELGVKQEIDKVDVTPELLQQYVGTYALSPNFKIVITAEDTKLFAQATSQPKFEIFPRTATRFYYKVVNAQIEFYKDDNGKVNKLVLFQNGRELPGTREE